MREYINFNTRLRAAAKNDFEKDFYKLINNSVFGKTMRPNFKSGTLIGPDLMGCKMGKIKVVMNKPVYLGQAILDLS